MEENQSEQLRIAVFRILELVHGKSDLNEMFIAIHGIISGLLNQNNVTDPATSLLLSRIDHDLRTPMCGILGFAELLSEELTEAETKKKAENILISSRRLMEVLDNLMTLSVNSPAQLLVKPVSADEQSSESPDSPTAPVGPARNPSGATKRHRSSGKKLPTVLIVEDNLVNIQLLMIYIRRYCNIFSTQNAKSAILLTSEQKFDAILMDINLGPGMDGIQAMQEIRKQPGNSKIPIIAVTGYATYGDRERFLKDGFTEYIRKPIDRDEIRQVLERFFLQ
jgi:CheY-like chemotaxis protein